MTTQSKPFETAGTAPHIQLPENGSLSELSAQQTVLVVFLRHFG